MKPQELSVRVGELPVGTLYYEDYAYSFRYERPEKLDPHEHLVSLTMPVRARAYETQMLPPPFQSVLPEGELLSRLRMRFGKVLRLDDDFALLALVGSHTIGRVTFARADGPMRTRIPGVDLDLVLRHVDGKALLEELIESYGFRIGVGGVQPKALLSTGSLHATVPTKDFLIKLSGDDYPMLTINEFFCMEASRAAGIPTADAQLSNNHELLVVRRFDQNSEGQVLAFEEMCALLQLSRHGKYDGSYEGIARVIAQIPCANTQSTLRDFFAMLVLSMTLRNGDAHLKNFGVLYEQTASVTLAPSYDLVTTTAYLTGDQPALALGGRKAWPTRQQLELFGLQSCNLRRPAIREVFERVETGIARTLERLQRFAVAHAESAALCDAMSRAWRDGLATLKGA